jgi:hypothetical protein
MSDRAGGTTVGMALDVRLTPCPDEAIRDGRRQVEADARANGASLSACCAWRCSCSARRWAQPSSCWFAGRRAGPTSRRSSIEDEREAATVIYRSGDRSITYTIVSGTATSMTRPHPVARQRSTPGGGKVEIMQAQTDGVLALTRKRAGRTILRTGAPLSPRLARTMRRLAVRGVSSELG